MAGYLDECQNDCGLCCLHGGIPQPYFLRRGLAIPLHLKERNE